MVPQEVIILIVIIIAVVILLTTNSVEYFSESKDEYIHQEYLRDLHHLCSLVGPYITGVYEYLRIKYLFPERGTAPIVYKPVAGDHTLTDPLLPAARSQVKTWIDSVTLKMNQRYGALLPTFQAQDSLTYVVNPDSTLTLTYNTKGQSLTYIV